MFDSIDPLMTALIGLVIAISNFSDVYKVLTKKTSTFRMLAGLAFAGALLLIARLAFPLWVYYVMSISVALLVGATVANIIHEGPPLRTPASQTKHKETLSTHA